MKYPKFGTPDFHEHKILVDTVKNPLKAFFFNVITVEEAKKKLMEKYDYKQEDIERIRGKK